MQNGCVYMPTDFKSMEFDYLKKELEKGNISISGQPIGFMSDGWSFLLYLRARNEDSPIVDLITKGGPCKMLTEEGCSYTPEKRPLLGLALKPTKVGGPCEKLYTPNEILAGWLENQDVLKELIKIYSKKETIEIVVEQISKQIKSIKNKINQGQELTTMEKMTSYWFCERMANKPYYDIDEVKDIMKHSIFSL